MNQDHTAHIAVDPKELHTVRDWVRFYVSEMRRGQVFFGHGSSNAFDEAVYMVQSALSLPVGDVGPFWDARVTAHETNRLIRFITQRVVIASLPVTSLAKPGCKGTPSRSMKGSLFRALSSPNYWPTS